VESAPEEVLHPLGKERGIRMSDPGERGGKKTFVLGEKEELLPTQRDSTGKKRGGKAKSSSSGYGKSSIWLEGRGEGEMESWR